MGSNLSITKMSNDGCSACSAFCLGRRSGRRGVRTRCRRCTCLKKNGEILAGGAALPQTSPHRSAPPPQLSVCPIQGGASPAIRPSVRSSGAEAMCVSNRHLGLINPPSEPGLLAQTKRNETKTTTGVRRGHEAPTRRCLHPFSFSFHFVSCGLINPIRSGVH